MGNYTSDAMCCMHAILVHEITDSAVRLGTD